jgi:hypothetical protein
MLEDDAQTAARLLGAAGTLRHSPGQATGWAFTVGARVDADRIIAGAAEAIGAEAVAAALAAGAADPRGAVERVIDSAALACSASA